MLARYQDIPIAALPVSLRRIMTSCKPGQADRRVCGKSRSGGAKPPSCRRGRCPPFAPHCLLAARPASRCRGCASRPARPATLSGSSCLALVHDHRCSPIGRTAQPQARGQHGQRLLTGLQGKLIQVVTRHIEQPGWDAPCQLVCREVQQGQVGQVEQCCRD